MASATIDGFGALLVLVHSADQFAEAIRRKLVLEIAGNQPRVIPTAATASGKRIDSLIDEKLREQWMRCGRTAAAGSWTWARNRRFMRAASYRSL